MTDCITVTGNIATEPEHKRTPAGVAITSFRVASGQRRYDRATSTWVDAGTNWFSVSLFRGLAEHAFQSLRKGDRVILTGRLRLREWDNGAKKGISAEIEAESIGHDLLWGTTTFERAAGSAPGTPPAAAAQTAEEWPAAGEPADRWSIPGSADAPQLELIGAAAGSEGADAAPADTPF